MNTIANQIRQTVAGWPGVGVAPHRFGGTEFRVDGHEIGHLHGSRVADLPFPRAVRERLVAEGRAVAHHHLPDTGWVSFWLTAPDDVPRAVELFRLNYERITGASRAREAREDGAPSAGDGVGAVPGPLHGRRD